MNDVRIETPGIAFSSTLEQFPKCVAVRAALHARQHIPAGMLQGHVERSSRGADAPQSYPAGAA